MLLEEPGEVVTRDELRARLWSSDGSVDFEDGLNHAIRKLREALGDSAQHPRCVETLPRHGYRFIAPVERTDALDVLPLESAEKCQREGSGKPAAPAGSWLAQPLDAHDNVGAVRELPLLQRRVFAVAGLGLVALVAILLRPTGAALSDSLPESGRMSRLAPPLEIESVAVLPLENLSRDPEQEYFSDGMTEELITILAKMGSFGVIGQASVMQYKGTKKPLPQIARELNVDALVEGTVLRSGDRARVTACLVHAATGRQLWAATYESELRDISSSQGQVAQAIAHAIGLRHTNQQQARLRTSRPTTPEAYEAFLKGRHYWDIQMPEGQLKCIEYYKRAIQADGKYALAYAQMAHCYDTLSFWEFPPRS
jgi:TolB-like protein/DNA-binding winged helix-turn-helix (wHTH) protein